MKEQSENGKGHGDALVFSDVVLEESGDTSNVGEMVDPDGHAKVTGSCGDTMEIFMGIEAERISYVSFRTDGCVATMACGSMLAKCLEGTSVTCAESVSADNLIASLDGLPEERRHCADLTIRALREAIENWRSTATGQP